MNPDSDRPFLRHVVAVIAYRGGRVLRDAPPEFAAFRLAEDGRTASQILAHVGDLLDWSLTLLEGTQAWRETPPGAWERDVERFFRGLERVDQRLASPAPLGCPPERLFQGPLADALTHVGQLAMLRRLAGSKLRGENFYVADIAAGRVGSEQAAPRREFD
jgi:hypothetical protein